MVSKDSIEKLKDKIDIVEIVNSYIPLKRSGYNFKACCPFHGEKTPSFVVNPQKNFYHCFGCSVSGDAIKFVMEFENIDFIDAIKKIADFYNFELQETNDVEQFKKKNLHKPLEILNYYYKKLLPHKKEALEYLKSRGLTDESIERFEIGFAPDSHNTIKFLNKYIELDLAIESGAIIKDEKNTYARFIDRITFPIYSNNSKIVGFGGRTITNHPAKYINSNQSELFNKSSLLYGYNLARKEIHKQKEIIITEGYLDVIMLHQAGFGNAVATLGTALTKEHLPLLKRDDSKVILAFDGDKAGINAGLKASYLLAKEFVGGVVIFENSLDPADYVKLGRVDELKKAFKSYKPFIEFILESIAKEFDISNPIEKDRAYKKMVEYLKNFSSLIQKEYIELIESILDVKITKEREPKEKLHFTNDDMMELSLLKTIAEKPTYLDLILDRCDDRLVFKKYQNLVNAIKNNNFEDNNLKRILLNDSIKICSEDELQKSISNILIDIYNKNMEQIKSSKELPFEIKGFYLRKSQDSISRLRQGELLTYEVIKISS